MKQKRHSSVLTWRTYGWVKCSGQGGSAATYRPSCGTEPARVSKSACLSTSGVLRTARDCNWCNKSIGGLQGCHKHVTPNTTFLLARQKYRQFLGWRGGLFSPQKCLNKSIATRALRLFIITRSIEAWSILMVLENLSAHRGIPFIKQLSTRGASLLSLLQSCRSIP